jgi:hypothetical protein
MLTQTARAFRGNLATYSFPKVWLHARTGRGGPFTTDMFQPP